MVGADRVRVPQIPIDPAALAAAPDEDHRAVARDLREVGARRLPGQERGGTGGKAGLQDIAAAERRRLQIIRHLGLPSPARADGGPLPDIARPGHAGCQAAPALALRDRDGTRVCRRRRMRIRSIPADRPRESGHGQARREGRAGHRIGAQYRSSDRAEAGPAKARMSWSTRAPISRRLRRSRARPGISGSRRSRSSPTSAKKVEVEAMAAKALSEFGRVDILINNAAIRPHKPFTRNDRRGLGAGPQRGS